MYSISAYTYEVPVTCMALKYSTLLDIASLASGYAMTTSIPHQEYYLYDFEAQYYPVAVKLPTLIIMLTLQFL